MVSAGDNICKNAHTQTKVRQFDEKAYFCCGHCCCCGMVVVAIFVAFVVVVHVVNVIIIIVIVNKIIMILIIKQEDSVFQQAVFVISCNLTIFSCPEQLLKSSCWSVGRSVRPSVRRSVGPSTFAKK